MKRVRVLKARVITRAAQKPAPLLERIADEAERPEVRLKDPDDDRRIPIEDLLRDDLAEG
ncbi:MAG: hypothetical protein JSU00_18825 [Acidobacteria bacterium]|nr:hypothetical protein [Acidobacteriota bacterium]